MKRILSTLLTLCLLLGLTPAALGAEDAETTFQYAWSQEGDTHTVTRVDDNGGTVMEEGQPAFTHSGTSARDAIWAVYDDAEVAHRVLSFVITLTTDVTLVGEPKGDSDVQAIAFQGGTVCWELNSRTMTLQNLSLGAGINNLTTLRNGTVKAGGTAKFPVLYARNGGELILDNLTASRDGGGALVSAGTVAAEEENSSITIRDSTLTTGVQGGTNLLGNALQVNGQNASMTLKNTAVTGHAPTYPVASVTGGALTMDGNSSITATAEKVAAATVNGGELYLNGGTLTPGAGGCACGGRTNGTLHLKGGATASSVELWGGDQIVDDGYTGGQVVLTCTGGQKTGEILVTGCADETAAKQFISSAQNPVGLSYAEQNGGYAVVAAEAPVQANKYTITQDESDRYTVTGEYEDGGSYVLVHEEPSYQIATSALFNDVRGTGATIRLGGDLTIAGTPKGDGSYPTTGVGEGWITWDLAGHTLTLQDICMLADYQGTLTVKNGTVKHESISDKASPHGALFGAQMDGELILEDVTATRADGGRLLGAYPANSYYPPYDAVTGAAITAANCTLDNDRDETIKDDPDAGSNAILAGADSSVSLIKTAVESGASWAVAAVYGTLNVDDSSSVTSTEETTFPTAAVSSVEGTVYLGGGAGARAAVTGAALTGDVAMRDQGGSKFHLSGNVRAATIEIAGPGVVDAAGYTGGKVMLTYTGGDVLANVPLVTGCNSAKTAQKFKLTAGAPANIGYEEQQDGSFAAVAAATPLTETEFTKNTVYSISSKAELERLATLVNGGATGAGSFFALTGNVDLKGGKEDQWPTIGREDAPFAGVFDGGGHTVSGLCIDTDADDQGLFGVVDSYGSVSNLTVAGAVRGGERVGGVAGCVKQSGALTACQNSVDVSGANYVGGVAGELSGSARVERSCNTGAVSATGDFAGGIAGQMTPPSTLVKDCYNTGDISAQRHAGGLAGSASNGASLQNSWNTGGVSAAVYGAGGICGQLTPTSETRGCVSLGLSVSSGKNVGRVVGKAHAAITLAGNFARSDMALNGGALTGTTARQNGVDGESVTLSGNWQKAAFAGWDFDTVWNEGEGDSLPTLKAVKTAPITLPRPASNGGSSGSGGGSESSKPTVTAGEGGTVKADSMGNVTIIPDEGWRIACVTVNGKAVEIPKDGVLTGLKSRDKVAVIFEVIPQEPVLTPDQFTDLDPDAWYYDAVSYMLANGLFRGTSENTFSPGVPMSRAMIFTVLHRMSGEEGTAVDGTPWYAPALAWAVENGISDGSNPDGEITREQLVTMLHRCAKTLPGYTPEGSGCAASFPDYSLVSSYAEEAVQWAVGHGILTGKGNGTLAPTGTATRAEVAVMLMRYCETQ